MDNFNLRKYISEGKIYKPIKEDVTPKDKARVQQLYQKAINDPNLDADTLNKIKSALTSKKLSSVSSDRVEKTKQVLDKYAGKFNLPRTISKYVEAANVKPQFKFQFEKLFEDPKNLITRQELEKSTSGNLLDLVSKRFKNNPVFKDVTDYLLTFRARQKGVGESWLLTFGHNAEVTEKGDVSVNGYNLEVKDGSGKFSVDTKLGNKYIHDNLNIEFFDAFGVTSAELVNKSKERKTQSTNLANIRKRIKDVADYLSGKKKRKPNKSTIPSDEDFLKYSNISPDDVKDLRERFVKTVKSYVQPKQVNEAKNKKKVDPRLGAGLDYTNPSIKKFLIQQKRENPKKLKSELSKYYNALYKGATIDIDELVNYIFDNISNSTKIVNALSTFLLKQYFSKEGFDSLMVVNPNNFKYDIFTTSYINSLSYGDQLSDTFKYEPKFKRQSDQQNLSDGWVNIEMKK